MTAVSAGENYEEDMKDSWEGGKVASKVGRICGRDDTQQEAQGVS